MKYEKLTTEQEQAIINLFNVTNINSNKRLQQRTKQNGSN
mgnify:CR=1 FL=1